MERNCQGEGPYPKGLGKSQRVFRLHLLEILGPKAALAQISPNGGELSRAVNEQRSPAHANVRREIVEPPFIARPPL